MHKKMLNSHQKLVVVILDNEIIVFSISLYFFVPNIYILYYLYNL